MPNYQGHHLNEHLCLRAAQLCGLPAAATELLAGDKYEVLISHRYDRHQDPDGRWRRLHQEDFCQALSISPSKKYQSDGGPGPDQLGDLLSSRSLGSHRRGNLQTMFDYLVFNVAIAATDAHAKNFSLLLSSRSVRLAPLYDVASYLPYEHGRGLRSAMKIGATWDLASVSEQDWIAVGRRLGLTSEESVSRMRSVRSRVPVAFHQAAAEAGVPALLRSRASWIADLVTAQLEGRRDRWGQLDVAPPEH